MIETYQITAGMQNL